MIIGGGVPKNFAQDTVICAEVLGKEVDMHKYAVQITVADATVSDGPGNDPEDNAYAVSGVDAAGGGGDNVFRFSGPEGDDSGRPYGGLGRKRLSKGDVLQGAGQYDAQPDDGFIVGLYATG